MLLGARAASGAAGAAGTAGGTRQPAPPICRSGSGDPNKQPVHPTPVTRVPCGESFGESFESPREGGVERRGGGKRSLDLDMGSGVSQVATSTTPAAIINEE